MILPGRDAPPTALIVVNEDPWRLRRTHSTVGAVETLGWRAIIASPHSERLPARFEHARIGSQSRRAALRNLHGVLSRNVMRLAITVITLLPRSLRMPILASLSVPVLRIRELVRTLREQAPTVVVVHDVLLIVAVLHNRGATPVVFDAREFFPKQFEHSFWWRTLIGSGMNRLVKQVLPLCDAITTVSPGLRDGYRRLVSVDPIVVLNVPQRVPKQTGNAEQHRQVDPLGTPLRIVYHGAVNANRGLSSLIAAVKPLDGRIELDLYLVGSQRLVNRLKHEARDVTNATVCDPVDFMSIPAVLAAYHVGLVFYEDSSFNLRHAMPSKLFEYIQAGLAVVVGPSPSMANIIRQYDCGVVTKSFSPADLTSALDGINPARLQEMRANALKASTSLCAEVEYGKVQTLLSELASPSDR